MKRLVLILLAVLAVLLGATLFWLGDGGAPVGAPTTSAAPDIAAPAGAASEAEGIEADNSFAVCPGDPRCP